MVLFNNLYYLACETLAVINYRDNVYFIFNLINGNGHKYLDLTYSWFLYSSLYERWAGRAWATVVTDAAVNSSYDVMVTKPFPTTHTHNLHPTTYNRMSGASRLRSHWPRNLTFATEIPSSTYCNCVTEYHTIQ